MFYAQLEIRIPFRLGTWFHGQRCHDEDTAWKAASLILEDYEGAGVDVSDVDVQVHLRDDYLDRK